MSTIWLLNTVLGNMVITAIQCSKSFELWFYWDLSDTSCILSACVIKHNNYNMHDLILENQSHLTV